MTLFVFSLWSEIRAKDFAVEVSINGNLTEFDGETGKPFVNESQDIFVPLRTTMESMGIDVTWDSETKTTILSDDDTKVVISQDSCIILVNDEEVENEATTIMSGGKTYLPIKTVAEAFGASVEWNKSSNTVEIEYDKSLNFWQAICKKVAKWIERLFPPTNAYVAGDGVKVWSKKDTSNPENILRKTEVFEKINVVKVLKDENSILWCQLDDLEEEKWIEGYYVEIEDWAEILIEEVDKDDPALGKLQGPYSDADRISKARGAIINYDGRRETYYDLRMEVCYNRLWNLKDENGEYLFPKDEYPASIDEYGFKKFGPYVVVATNWAINDLGTLVNTSAGTAIVADTGTFKETFPTAIDIATNWTRENGSALD